MILPLRARRIGALAVVAIAGTLALPAAVRAEDVPSGGRAWELITPPDPIAATSPLMANPGQEDSRIVYATLGPLPGAPAGALVGSTTVTTRADAGWESTPIGFPYSFGGEFFTGLMPLRTLAFSADRLTSLWVTMVPIMPSSPPEGEHALYLRSADGDVSMISEVAGEGPLGYESLAELSPDGGQIVFSNEKHLLPADAGRTSGESLYRWTADAGLRLVDVGNDDSELSPCGATATRTGVSENGDRVFLVSPGAGGCPEKRRLYMREGDDSTVEVSASQCTRPDCNAPADIAFAGATPSGDRAFLTTTQQLTDDDIDATRDLYRYDVESGQLQLLTVAQPEANGEVMALDAIPSEDGERVYFRSTGRLVTGEGPEFGQGLHLADSQGLHFVSPLFSEDKIQASADGERLLLATRAVLAPTDEDSYSDAYLYDATSHDSVQLSRGPSGGNGALDARLESEVPGLFLPIPTPEPTMFIDADGQHAFFVTRESLTPADTNAVGDVYEWADGKLGLLSSGTSEISVFFGGVGTSGRTAFFTTDATLVPEDRDEGEPDIYGARVGGGFAGGEEEGCACPAGKAPSGPAEHAAPASESLGPRRARGRIELLAGNWRREGGRGPELSLLLRVPAAGFISAQLHALRPSRGHATLARGSGGAIRPGKARVTLRLTALGHRRLKRLGSLDGSLLVEQADRRLTRPSPPYPDGER